MAKRHYVLYCDESAKHGKYYSDFYAGALVSAPDQESIEAALCAKKEELNLFAELKWTKITENYLDKYIEFMKFYFSFVASGRLKIRVMFTQNMHRPRGLTQDHADNRYFLLYYQLIKHGFGFAHCNPNGLDIVFVSVFLDDMPDTREKVDKFRNYVSAISQLPCLAGETYSFQNTKWPS